MPEELQTWWQNTSPETRTAIWEGALVLGALLGGHILGVLVGRALRARNFDGLFRPTGHTAEVAAPGRSITPTTIAGLLVRLTAWTAAGWWLAREHDAPELAARLELIVVRTWEIVGILAAALALAGVLARRVVELLDGAPATGNIGGRPGTALSRGLGGAVGAGIYGLVLLLALLTVADNFNWPLTRTAAASLWQLAQNLLSAGAALLIAVLGARWARDQVTPRSGASTEDHAVQYTALGIIAGTTALAVGLLLFGAGLRIGVAVVAIVGVLLYLSRGRLPDVVAGLRLRKDKVHMVWFDGAPWQLAGIGLLQSEVTRGGESTHVPNRQVLEAFVHGTQAAANRPAYSR